MGQFEKDSVVLLKYRSGPTAVVPAYDRYVLENVMVRETFAADADAVNGDGAVVYFLDDRSICRTENGGTVKFPRPAKGDRCLLHAGTDAETNMRIAEAGYFTGGTLAHVRMKLK